MRELFAQVIASFAKFVTLGFGDERRTQVLLRARERIDTDVSVALSNGSRLLFCDNTQSTFTIIRDCQVSEPDTAAWISAMPEDGLLWDIGANVGFFTLFAASRLRREGVRVVAFEPGAANYGALNRNIECNAMADHAVAYCVALAAVTRIGRLNMDAAGRGTAAGGFYNGFESDIGPLDRVMNTQFRQGSVGFSIDDFVTTFQPPLPTHVKIDVDGIEAEILRGGRLTLSAASVQSVIIEMEGDLRSDRNQDLFGLMKELGFIPTPKPSPEMRNIIFVRSTSPA